MKKLLCVLLCLLLPLTALAAPTRDMRESALSSDELLAMRAWLDQTVRQALPVAYDNNMYVGAYVYSSVEDGGCFVLECDVYLEYNDDSLPDYAAEDALAWLCPATVCVRRVKDGYECVKCDIGAYYAVESFENYFDEENGFEVSLPDFFADNDDDYSFSCYDNDKNLIASVAFLAEERGQDDITAYAAALREEAEGDWVVDVEADIGLCTARAEGMYVVVYEAVDGFYSLTLTYPAEREAEFTLYAEFMRNSFLVSDLSNG